MKPVYITGVAAAMPNAPVANSDIETVLGKVGNQPSRARRLVLRRNGIRSRHYAIDPVSGLTTHTNASLTAEAIRNLRSDFFRVENIDCLACGTSFPDQILPNHAVMVHGELGQPGCEVIATAGVCLAGVSAMKYAWLGVASGEHECAVATGSEFVSPLLRASFFDKEVDAKVDALSNHPEIAFEKDFLRWMLSDGAGAVLLQSRPAHHALSLRIEWIMIRSYADEQAACMYSGAEKSEDGSLTSWKTTPPHQWLSTSIFAIKQDVKQLNENIVHYTVEKPLAELIKNKQLKAEEIDYFLPHYSSDFFREKLEEGLNGVGFHIPPERWMSNLTTKGNTGSASIYIMLEELMHSGKLRKGDRILCYVPESGRFSTSFMLFTVCDSGG
ncbi:MAG: beta-ketoacyl-ACP synthase III [Pseudomonadales bacterium]|nr:beta-ketoacyl-ACP synthase III [Pseudomonadales bacterium]